MIIQKPKKSDRKHLVKELDKIVSLIVRKRDGHCMTCPNPRGLPLTNGHLITRGKHSVRWDMENCFCQCTGCNMLHESQPEHFTRWFIKKFGIEKYDELYLRSNQIKNFKSWDLLIMLNEFKDLYSKMVT
jgi:hypothetical protein